MRRLTCEICGSTDLIKREGVFICQGCGCKYSVEEAKKIMNAELLVSSNPDRGRIISDSVKSTNKEENEEVKNLKEVEKEKEHITVKRIEINVKRILLITSLIIIAISALTIIFITIIIPKLRYNRAVDKYGKEFVDDFKDITVGEIFKFGSYEQDMNTSNGKEAVEWIVLAKEGNKALLISQYALDCQKFNTTQSPVSWERSSLRNWLNGKFIDTTFSQEENDMILTVLLDGDQKPIFNADPGNSTSDKVFLLSMSEVSSYMSSDEVKQCLPTPYAKVQGCSTRNNGKCQWWLRSSSGNANNIVRVNYYGTVDYYGDYAYSNGNAVRPAVWIDLGF